MLVLKPMVLGIPHFNPSQETTIIGISPISSPDSGFLGLLNGISKCTAYFLEIVEVTSMKTKKACSYVAPKVFLERCFFREFGDYNWLVVSPPLKNTSQLGWLFPAYGKIKNVPNHQPDNVVWTIQIRKQIGMKQHEKTNLWMIEVGLNHQRRNSTLNHWK